MIIAIIKNGKVSTTGDYRALFPNTSFPAGGPTTKWLAEQGCMYVNNGLPYDQNTEKLVPVEPYIVADDATHWVYTVVVASLSPEEIAEREVIAKQSNKRQAEQLLSDSDWSDKPSVTDTTKPLHLVNSAEWEAYRDALRAIAVVPPVTVEEWPTKPEEVWSV